MWALLPCSFHLLWVKGIKSPKDPHSTKIKIFQQKKLNSKQYMQIGDPSIVD
jgi:hypothetical protein